MKYAQLGYFPQLYNKPAPSVYLRHYCKPSLNDYLAHHGILGQKWGERNGPPYPLGPSDHSKSEKKAGWRKSLKNKDLTTKQGGANINTATKSGGNWPQNSDSMKPAFITNDIRKVAEKAGLKLKQQPMTVAEDCKAVDPDYSPENPLARNNCGKCSAAYVLRRMGLDVEAEDMTEKEKGGLYIDSFGKYFKGYKAEPLMTGLHFSKNGYKAALSQKILSLCDNKDGAMGLMLIGNGYSLGHFISWENINGEIHYIDSQSNMPNADGYFSLMASGQIISGAWVARLDNLEINPDTIRELVKNK